MTTTLLPPLSVSESEPTTLVRIDDWLPIPFPSAANPQPRILHGRVSGHPKVPDGNFVWTSRVVRVDGDRVWTHKGERCYLLGTPSEDYRQTRPGLDPAAPLAPPG